MKALVKTEVVLRSGEQRELGDLRAVPPADDAPKGGKTDTGGKQASGGTSR